MEKFFSLLQVIEIWLKGLFRDCISVIERYGSKASVGKSIGYLLVKIIS